MNAPAKVASVNGRMGTRAAPAGKVIIVREIGKSRAKKAVHAPHRANHSSERASARSACRETPPQPREERVPANRHHRVGDERADHPANRADQPGEENQRLRFADRCDQQPSRQRHRNLIRYRHRRALQRHQKEDPPPAVVRDEVLNRVQVEAENSERSNERVPFGQEELSNEVSACHTHCSALIAHCSLDAAVARDFVIEDIRAWWFGLHL